MDAAHALVLDTQVTMGTRGLANEPITTAHLRASDGTVRVVRVVGGPSRSGGETRLAGYDVPVEGRVVRIDLRREERLRSPTLDWTRNVPATTWSVTALPVRFSLAVDASGTASRDLGAEALSELDVALRTWPFVSSTGFRATLAIPATSPALVPGDDGTNGVFWHDDAWPPELVTDAIAQTVLHTDATGNLHDTDIHVNGAAYRWSLDGAGATLDARGVLTHELGHALGLGHSQDPRATMYATHPPGTSWRSLEQDDRDGVSALYPGKGAAGCDEPGSAACPRGFVCVARVCERDGARGEVCSPCARVPGACDGAGDDARCIDIGDGATAGTVCGRACSVDADCGARFRCAPTTSSGDVQCVPLDACAAGPDPCRTDAECGGDVCRSGACVGAAPPSGVVDAGAIDADAGPEAQSIRSSRGCAAARGASFASPYLALWIVAAGVYRRRMRASCFAIRAAVGILAGRKPWN